MSYNSLASESVATQLLRLNGDGDANGTGDFTALRGTNGTQTGTITFGTGKYSAGKTFGTSSNANYITTTASSFATTVPFTIACRVSVASSTGVRGILSATGSSNSFVRFASGSLTVIEVRISSGTVLSFTIAAVSLNTLVSLVVTRDSSNNVEVYADGVRSVSGPQAGGALTFVPGTICITNALTLNGTLEDYRIYNRAWNQSEVTEFHNGPEPTFSSAPTITGDLVVGEELTAVSGTLVDPGNGAITSTYEWELNGVDLIHIGETFTPTEAGSYVIYQTAGNTGGDTVGVSIEYEVVAASTGSDIKMSMGMGLSLS